MLILAYEINVDFATFGKTKNNSDGGLFLIWMYSSRKLVTTKQFTKKKSVRFSKSEVVILFLVTFRKKKKNPFKSSKRNRGRFIGMLKFQVHNNVIQTL